MNRTERFYRIEQLLRDRGVVSLETFLEVLEVSRATFKRDLEYLRDRLNAPIQWDRDAGGYKFDKGQQVGPAFELPGLWFTASELHALLAAHQILASLEPGMLSSHIEPIKLRLMSLLDSRGHPADEVAKRVKLSSMGRRHVDPKFFAEVARATFERKKIDIIVFGREKNEETQRIVSPQRLIHYRDNWYLDGWCHKREWLRLFAMENIRQIHILDEPALDVPESELDKHFHAGYGVFSGPKVGEASLRFNADSAKWVEHEIWHQDQIAERLPDGSYRLRIPYADVRELAMDILRHGSNVIVEEPESLRQLIAEESQRIVLSYSG